MSIATSTAKIQYTLSAAVQALPIPFYFLENAHIKAIRARSGVADYVMVLGTDYTLAGAGDEAGGTLTTIATNLAIGDKITIKRDIAITQQVNYVYNDRFPAETHERALDKLTMVTQQLKEVTDRAVQFPESEVAGTGNIMPAAAGRAAKILGFDATGNAVQLYDPVSAVFASGVGIEVSSLAALKAVSVTALTTGYQARVSGYYGAAGDGAGVFIYDSASSETADNGYVVAPNAGTGRWKRVPTGHVFVEDFGAKGDGLADDNAAIQAALDYVSANSLGTVNLRAKTYLINSALAAKANVIMRGAGHSTVIKAGLDGYTLIANAGTLTGSFELRDLKLWGYADRNATMNGDLRLTNISVSDSLKLWNVYGVYARGMGITGQAVVCEVENCRVEKTLRDSINMTGSYRVRVKGNKIKDSGDDAIAVHMETLAAYSLLNHNLIVDDNEIEMAYGIKILGAQNGQVTNNRTNRVKGYHLYWTLDSTEGLASMKDVVIANNVFKNVMNANEWGGSAVHYGIYLDGRVQVGDGTLNPTNLLPGEFDDTGNDWTNPESYDRHFGGPLPATTMTVTADAASTAALTRAIIANNIIAQDLPTATNYSDLGYGLGWKQNGESDGTSISFIGQGTSGLRLGIHCNNVTVRGNKFYGWAVGSDIGQWATTSTTSRCRNITYEGNSFIRCTQGIVASQTVATVHFDNCAIIGNLFDLDPFINSGDRNADGSWTNTSTTSMKAVNLHNTLGWYLDGNRFKNCKASVHGTATYRNNRPVYYAETANSAAGHKGVDAFDGIQTGGTLMECVCDPTSANYRGASFVRSASFLMLRSSAMPSVGWYLAGLFVYHSAPTKDGNNMVLLGWARKTTGTAHVSGTDWEPIYGSTVSPAA